MISSIGGYLRPEGATNYLPRALLWADSLQAFQAASLPDTNEKQQ